tara:strand:- start:1223 stop:1396 length:174 start_codon:yes stop_codon:yes gene_type:complete
MIVFEFWPRKGASIAKSEKPSSSAFSDFFRKAPSRKRKKVFLEVAKKASADQRAYTH